MSKVLTPSKRFYQVKQNLFYLNMSWTGSGDASGGIAWSNDTIDMLQPDDIVTLRHVVAEQNNAATDSFYIRTGSSSWSGLYSGSSFDVPLASTPSGGWNQYGTALWLSSHLTRQPQVPFVLGKKLVASPTIVIEFYPNTDSVVYRCGALFVVERQQT